MYSCQEKKLFSLVGKYFLYTIIFILLIEIENNSFFSRWALSSFVYEYLLCTIISIFELFLFFVSLNIFSLHQF